MDKETAAAIRAGNKILIERDLAAISAVESAPRKTQAEAETGYPMDTYNHQGELIAWDREETDECERGTPGCSVHHTKESECETW